MTIEPVDRLDLQDRIAQAIASQCVVYSADGRAIDRAAIAVIDMMLDRYPDLGDFLVAGRYGKRVSS